MGKTRQEKVAFGFCLCVLAGAAWFWALQVGDVLELLALASG